MRVKRPQYIWSSWPLIKKIGHQNSRQGWHYNIQSFVTLNAKNVKNEQKMETSGPYRGDVGPFWAWSASKEQNVGPSRAPATCHTCQTSLARCHMLQKSSSLPWVASWSPRPSSHLQGADPHGSNLCQNVLMRVSFFFSMQGLVITLSCLCHPSNHLMGSSTPWRSELIISPCAPILWYLSAGHGPAHQRLRPPGAHQS